MPTGGIITLISPAAMLPGPGDIINACNSNVYEPGNVFTFFPTRRRWCQVNYFLLNTLQFNVFDGEWLATIRPPLFIITLQSCLYVFRHRPPPHYDHEATPFSVPVLRAPKYKFSVPFFSLTFSFFFSLFALFSFCFFQWWCTVFFVPIGYTCYLP